MKFPWVLESVQTPFTQLYPFAQNLTRRLHTNIYPYKNFPLIFMFISKLSFIFQCSLWDCEQDLTGLYTQCELKELWIIKITIAAMIEYLLCCKHCAYNTCFFFYFLFFYLFLALLGLRFCARAFSSCGKRGPLFIAVRGPLTIVASLVAEHRLQMHRLSSCGSRA